MPRISCLSAFSLVFFALANQAKADIIVDQSQLLDEVYMAQFGQTDLAQSFQQSFDNIVGARVKLTSEVGSGTGDITIQLWDNLPNAAGNLLASGVDLNVAVGEWAEVSFGSLISVIPNTTLYLVFLSSNLGLGLSGSVNNPYPRGNVFANSGFESFPTFDYTFETLADNGSSAVPEPTSIMLVGVGACLIWGFGRSRRAKLVA